MDGIVGLRWHSPDGSEQICISTAKHPLGPVVANFKVREMLHLSGELCVPGFPWTNINATWPVLELVSSDVYRDASLLEARMRGIASLSEDVLKQSAIHAPGDISKEERCVTTCAARNVLHCDRDLLAARSMATRNVDASL